MCAVVGPNGAGKSTLLALAAGLLAPTEGTVRVLGAHPATARPRVGFVSQDKPLYPQLTVAETLRMGADLNPGHWDADTALRAVAGGDLDPGRRIRARGLPCAAPYDRDGARLTRPRTGGPCPWGTAPSCREHPVGHRPLPWTSCRRNHGFRQPCDAR